MRRLILEFLQVALKFWTKKINSGNSKKPKREAVNKPQDETWSNGW